MGFKSKVTAFKKKKKRSTVYLQLSLYGLEVGMSEQCCCPYKSSDIYGGGLVKYKIIISAIASRSLKVERTKRKGPRQPP